MPARTVGRIRTRAAFRQLQRSRLRGSSGTVRATFVPATPATDAAFPLVGYAIGKRCGNAVTRNALRRRLREAVREAAPNVPVGTYLLRAEPAATIDPGGPAVGRRDPGHAAGRQREVVMTSTTTSSTAVDRPGPASRVAVRILRAYQGASSGKVSPCRFYPSCSNYAVEAFSQHGFWHGLSLTSRRLLRCRPFGPHGVDLVPLPVHHQHQHLGRHQP